MKSKEELNALKEEAETASKKLAELTEEELAQVSGGDWGVQEYETFLSKPENGGVHSHFKIQSETFTFATADGLSNKQQKY